MKTAMLIIRETRYLLVKHKAISDTYYRIKREYLYFWSFDCSPRTSVLLQRVDVEFCHGICRAAFNLLLTYV